MHMMNCFGIFLSVFIFTGLFLSGQSEEGWKQMSSTLYKVHFTDVDREFINEYNSLLKAGCDSVQSFFRKSFPHFFDVFIFPDRRALDSSWQVDWKSPGFKSECWMVASGVAKKIVMLSPARWDTQSCEHTYSDKKSSAQLIAHELFHVFHGQFNVSSDFTNTEGIDWFVEGLATYASGQYTRSRILEVKTAILHQEIPSGLDRFWTGKLRYGLSGSVVAFIDEVYGRAALQNLLVFNSKSEIFAYLGITESKLLSDWRKYMISQ